MVPLGVKAESDYKKKGRIFKGDDTVLDLDRELGYKHSCICQNSANVHWRFVCFNVWKFLHVNTKNFKDWTLGDGMHVEILMETYWCLQGTFEMHSKSRWSHGWTKEWTGKKVSRVKCQW